MGRKERLFRIGHLFTFSMSANHVTNLDRWNFDGTIRVFNKYQLNLCPWYRFEKLRGTRARNHATFQNDIRDLSYNFTQYAYQQEQYKSRFSLWVLAAQNQNLRSGGNGRYSWRSGTKIESWIGARVVKTSPTLRAEYQWNVRIHCRNTKHLKLENASSYKLEFVMC